MVYDVEYYVVLVYWVFFGVVELVFLVYFVDDFGFLCLLLVVVCGCFVYLDFYF